MRKNSLLLVACSSFPNQQKSIEDTNNIKISNEKRSEVLQDGGHRNWGKLTNLSTIYPYLG